MSMVTIVLYGIYLYVLIGMVTAAAFLTFGVTRIFVRPAPVTIPARILLAPGTIVLWPLILARWCAAGNSP